MGQTANAQLKDSSLISGEANEFKHHASTSSAQFDNVQNVNIFIYTSVLSLLVTSCH